MSVSLLTPNVTTAATTTTTPTTGTTSTGSTTANSSSAVTSSAGSLEDEFLQMLTVQLQNQDPTDPVDETDMLSQLAQFSSLEEMQNLNTTMSNSASFSGLTQSASLIGAYVTTTNSDGSAGPSGQVSSVVMQNGVPYLQIGSNQVAASTVTTVSTTPPSSTSTGSSGS